MFVCNPCLDRFYENLPSAWTSYGRCEGCGVADDCSSLSSDQLIIKSQVHFDGDIFE